MKKVALITGASSGIGMELARLHASAGGDLVVVARSEQKLIELKQELENLYGVEVFVIAKDLTFESAPLEVYEQVKEHGIEVTYLINNAGFGGYGLFYERDWVEDRNMIQLNMITLTTFCKLFLPDFVQRGKGRILNVSSTASLVPGPLQAVYFATKAYVTSLSNAMASELEGTGVTVTALLPGAVSTGFSRAAGMENSPLFRDATSPKKIAYDGYVAMLQGDLNVISGLPPCQKYTFPLLQVMPKRMVMSVVRKMQQQE